MQRYITHEPLSAGIFNRDFNGATTSCQSWNTELQNSCKALALMCQRMQSDFVGLHPKMRKPWTLRDLEPSLK